MSRIEELFNKFCPDGGEFKELQEVFEINNGYTPSKANPDFWTDGEIPWLLLILRSEKFSFAKLRQSGVLALEHNNPVYQATLQNGIHKFQGTPYFQATKFNYFTITANRYNPYSVYYY